MKTQIYNEEQFRTSGWAGGSTRELAIFPVSAAYLERDFIWRLSSAAVEVEESAFTRLPDYERVLLVLEGEAVLAHGEERSVKLSAMEQDTFDGGVKTRCFGKLRDYNLMYRKGCRGRLRYITAESASRPLETGDRTGFTHSSWGVYCVEGYLVVSVNGETSMVKEGRQMVIDAKAEEDLSLSFMGEGAGVLAEIFYNREEYKPEEIPNARATPEDFRVARRLALGNHGWQKVFKREKRRVWYDEALQKKLRFLERTYATPLLWLVGVLAVLGIGLANLSPAGTLVALLLWTAIHILLVGPLIYLAVLPKPIAAHIKDVDSLSAYERELYEAQKEEDPRLEKILKKYKHSGVTEYMGYEGDGPEEEPKK